MKYLLSALLLIPGLLLAQPAIYKVSSPDPMTVTYGKVKDALEAQKLWVVFEPNIGNNLAGFADKWGENYNRNGLDGLRSLVFCNVWYANEVSNMDPDMLAICPLKVTLTEKDSVTTALFVLPSAIAGDSPALPVLVELEDSVKLALKSAGFH